MTHWRGSSAHEGSGRANTDTQCFDLVKSEGTCCNPVVRSTVEMAAVVDPFPEWCHRVLNVATQTVRPNVFEKPEFAIRLHDAVDFLEGLRRVLYRTEHRGGDDHVKHIVRIGKTFSPS